MVVQRASRDQLLGSLRDALNREDWREVATRLNGFNAEDIQRLATGLTVGQAASTRAAVQEFLAGWPNEGLIIASLDRGRAEVARIGTVYATYTRAVANADWNSATEQLHVMTHDDVTRRLVKLGNAELTAIRGAAANLSPHVLVECDGEIARRGGSTSPTPISTETPGSDPVGALLVGGKLIVDGMRFTQAREAALARGELVARGAGARVGQTVVAEGEVIVTKIASNAPKAGLIGGAVESVGVVPVVGVCVAGAAVGAAIALSPLAIAHAQTVADRLGEFGGTLPPGGTGGDGGGNDSCRDCAPGTTEQHQPLDSLGRATGGRARIKGQPSPGSKPQTDPAGWGAQAGGGSGGSGHSGQGRAHLLAESLGGHGIAENLVTFDQSRNRAMFDAVEKTVLDYTWTTPNNCVSYQATPLYEGTSLVPWAIDIRAWDECTGKTIVVDRIINQQLH